MILNRHRIVRVKHFLLMIAVVVGCGGKKDDGNTGVVNPNKPQPKAASEKLITDPIVEKAIRKELEKPTGELTEADLEKITHLSFYGQKLTEVPKELENLTQLERLYLKDNPDLTKVQIAELQKALPKCEIFSNPKK